VTQSPRTTSCFSLDSRLLHRPQARPLGLLLQSPAHRVLRVLQVTQTHWQLPPHQRRQRRALAQQLSQLHQFNPA
jgi:hypothetical protein